MHLYLYLDLDLDLEHDLGDEQGVFHSLLMVGLRGLCAVQVGRMIEAESRKLKAGRRKQAEAEGKPYGVS